MAVKDTALEWYKIIPIERQQVVSKSNQTSYERYIQYGVVQ